MKKWNCNIVKDMYDRVIRRKFGLLCSDDTSNEAFLESYRNRLDCEVVDVSCYGDNEPCKESSTFTQCNISVTVDYNVQKKNFTFIANVTGGTAPYTYNWVFNPFIWNFVSQIGNTITLEAALPSTPSMGVSVNVEDSLGCKDSTFVKGPYLGGCTDPDAVNYNPNANYDDDSCYYEPLTLITGYTCNEFEAGDWCATVSGGVAPYTLVGIPSGTIATDGGSYCEVILNSNPWNCYVVDSVGNVTPIQLGTIVCPFDCDDVRIGSEVNVVCLTDSLGNNTGQGELYITITGGTAPYSTEIFINSNPGIPFVDGMVLNNGDAGYFNITDANGCTREGGFNIDCPATPGGCDTDCNGLLQLFTDNSTFFTSDLIINNVFLGTGGWVVDYTIQWNIGNIPSCLTMLNFATVGVSVFNDSAGLTSQTAGGSPCNPCTYLGTPSLNDFTLQAQITSNFCEGSGLLRLMPDTDASALVPIPNPNLYLEVDYVFTVTLPNGSVCQFCANGLFSLEYDPCTIPFTPVQQNIILSIDNC
jgi:hypothetical protein